MSDPRVLVRLVMGRKIQDNSSFGRPLATVAGVAGNRRWGNLRRLDGCGIGTLPSPDVVLATLGKTPVKHVRFFSLSLVLLCGLVCAASCSNSPTSPSAGKPALTLSTTTLLFSAQDLGTTSAAQVMTLRNTGSGTVTFSGITASAEFAATNDCNSSLGVAASCTITVTFSPAALGTRTGLLTIQDNAAPSPQVVALAGGGGIPTLSMSPTNITFNDVSLGSGTNQTITLTNNGTTDITMGSISTTGDFSQTNNCGTTLASTNSCTITVRFTPTDIGPRLGELIITDSAPGNPHSASLSGSGLSVTKAVFLLQPSLTFPNQAVGSTSRAITAQFTNAGISALTLYSITASGDFAQTNSCPTTLQPQAVCTMNVTFTPTAAGTRTGTITISDDATSGNQTITLTGTGTDGGSGAQLTVSPGAVTFANQVVATSSPVQSITLTNAGASALSINGVSINDDFSQSNGCGSTLAPGAKCTIGVTFTPTTVSTHAGMLTINDSAPGSPHTVPLTGKGIVGSPTAPLVVLSVPSLVFSAQLVGTTSAAQTVTLTNTGKSQLNISSLGTDGDFTESDNCNYAVAAGGSCTLTVTFTPTAIGSRTGRVTIADDATNSPQVLALGGTGGSGLVTMSPTYLSFGTVTVGTTSASQAVTVENNGTLPVNILTVTISGDYAETDTCAAQQLTTGGGSCTVTVTFTPTTAGTRTGSVTITHDAPGSPQTFVLTGIGGSL
jgi:hypothetical protein